MKIVEILSLVEINKGSMLGQNSNHFIDHLIEIANFSKLSSHQPAPSSIAKKLR